MNDKKLKLVIINTNHGCYISKFNKKYNNYYSFSLLYDGKKPSKTFHDEWIKVDKIPEVITEIVKRKPINYRYILKKEYNDLHINDPEKYPKKLGLRENVAHKGDDECCWTLVGKYSGLEPFYEVICDKQSDETVPIEFEIVETFEFTGDEELEELNSFKYPTYNGVINQTFDKIIFPSVLLPLRPCKLTIKQSYDIVRKFIKDNIDSKYAEITSDYDFCFTVKKKIKMNKIEESVSVFISGHKKTEYINDRNVEVFEMCHKQYQSYTPIKPFEGKTLKDLEKNIDKFCGDLIEKINKPLIDCRHCEGTGVELDGISKNNK